MSELVNESPSVRVALVHLWAQPYTDNRASGLVYGFENLGKDLQHYGFNVDHIFLSNRKKNGNWHPLFQELPTGKAETLNSYDFIIFGSAGSGYDQKHGPWWKPVLDVLRVPFGVQINNEVDQNMLIHRQMFYDHEYFALLLPITEGLAHTAAPNMNMNKVFVYECLPRTGLQEPSQFYDLKRTKSLPPAGLQPEKGFLSWFSRRKDYTT